MYLYDIYMTCFNQLVISSQYVLYDYEVKMLEKRVGTIIVFPLPVRSSHDFSPFESPFYIYGLGILSRSDRYSATAINTNVQKT